MPDTKMSRYSSNQVAAWITASLKNEDIQISTIQTLGDPEKGEGYLADLIFVKVTGTNSDGKFTEINIAIKVSKSLTVFGDESHLYYEREQFVYSQVFTEFRRFELERHVKSIFQIAPKCFSALKMDGKILVVLENMKSKGYEMHDRTTPMNDQHIKAVLKSYAKLHALSFAFKNQKRVEFEKLTKNYASLYKILMNNNVINLFRLGIVETYQQLKIFDKELAEKLNKIVIEKKVENVLKELFFAVVEERVITHGDCWNNNFMFNYENENKEIPSQVMILDWQVSGIHSPMLDISHFLFLASSEEQVANFDQLLMYYHTSLSKCLAELGSDVEEIFPYTTMLKHWKQFSITGLMYATAFLNINTRGKEDGIQLDELKSSDELSQALSNIEHKNKDGLMRRLIATTKYYFELVK